MNTEQERSELLPCPFCGGEPYMEQWGNNRQSCIIACQDCGCSMETGETGHDCGGMWNQRAALQSQDMKPVIEALGAAQSNECGPHRPLGSSDPDSVNYNHDAFMWDYYQRAIDHARRVEGEAK